MLFPFISEPPAGTIRTNATLPTNANGAVRVTQKGSEEKVTVNKKCDNMQKTIRFSN